VTLRTIQSLFDLYSSLKCVFSKSIGLLKDSDRRLDVPTYRLLEECQNGLSSLDAQTHGLYEEC
jgi:hypothetical protein